MPIWTGQDTEKILEEDIEPCDCSFTDGETLSAPYIQETRTRRALCYSVHKVTQGEIRAALGQYASSHFGFSKKFVTQMQFSEIHTEGIFMYKLETFGEMRSKGSMSIPYNGNAIDNEENGCVPSLWDIPVYPHELFKDSERKVNIPHTDYVRQCLICKGTGYVKCGKCSGNGVMFCEICRNNAPLMLQGDRCYCCQRWGNGGLVSCCDVCEGNRELKCRNCRGYGCMKHSETLSVTWLTKVTEIAHRECKVPFIKLRDVIGTTFFFEEGDRVQPVIFPPEPEIGSASANLVTKHLGAFPHILKQRHSLRIVPVSRVNYSWKRKTGEFYLYGIENKIYFKNFPSKWTSCNLM